MTRIYIEKTGLGQRGPLYQVRLGEPDGPVIAKSTIQPLYDGSRALKAKGITGAVEMWDVKTPYARMRGDIESLAPWTITEKDKHFKLVRWMPFAEARGVLGVAKSESGLSE